MALAKGRGERRRRSDEEGSVTAHFGEVHPSPSKRDGGLRRGGWQAVRRLDCQSRVRGEPIEGVESKVESLPSRSVEFDEKGQGHDLQ